MNKQPVLRRFAELVTPVPYVDLHKGDKSFNGTLTQQLWIWSQIGGFGQVELLVA